MLTASTATLTCLPPLPSVDLRAQKAAAVEVERHSRAVADAFDIAAPFIGTVSEAITILLESVDCMPPAAANLVLGMVGEISPAAATFIEARHGNETPAWGCTDADADLLLRQLMLAWSPVSDAMECWLAAMYLASFCRELEARTGR